MQNSVCAGMSIGPAYRLGLSADREELCEEYFKVSREWGVI